MDGRDDNRLVWLACHGGERCAEHEGHKHPSHVEGHTRDHGTPPTIETPPLEHVNPDQAAGTDIAESSLG